MTVLRQVESPVIRSVLHFPAPAKRLEEVNILDTGLLQLLEQTTRLVRDDDARGLGARGEHVRIDALFAGHRNDQKSDSQRVKLIAERSDRWKRIDGIACSSGGLVLGQVAHAWSIEKPSVLSENGLLTGIREKLP